MTRSITNEDADRLARLYRLKREAFASREAILAAIGPQGRTPLLKVRVIEQAGGPRQHVSSEGETCWEEPHLLYLASFRRPDGGHTEELCVEEDQALRWAFALGWGED